MTPMRKSTYAAGILLLTAMTSAADIRWLETEYDYGTFTEVSGPKTGRARFVNTGDSATFVSRVRPSCGCTGASYPHTMIEPGDTAEITFTYNPKGRPGRFDKTVKVYTGTDNRLQVIRIFGTVIGAPATLEANFPHEAGGLRTQYPVLMAGTLPRGTARHMFLSSYNQTSDTITPAWGAPPPGLEVDMTPRAIAPGEIGTFSFYLKTAEVPADGALQYTVPIIPNPGSAPADTISVTLKAIVAPYNQ